MAATRPPIIHSVSREEGVRSLEADVRRFEIIYETSSQAMLQDVEAGRHDTAEIAEWMIKYRTLKRLAR